MASIEEIRGFLRLDDRIATSGMPRPEHFAAMRGAARKLGVTDRTQAATTALQRGLVHLP